MVYLKKTLKFLISYLIYFILNLIYPILKIRFGRIYASRIGHLCYNVDNYISKVKDKKNIITFFCYDEPVSNKFIFDLFKKKKNIFFTNKIRFLYYIIKNINSNSRLLVAFFDEMHPRISYTSASKRNLPKIRNYNLLNDFLKENNINENFICLSNRDNLYLKETKSLDKNFHDFRNFKVNSYDKTIKYLIDNGYSVIRVGKISENPINIKSDKFIDLTNQNYNEELQVLLIEKCYFFIGGSTGISQIPRLFRNPCLLINYIPFDLLEMTAWSKNSIFLPKKLFDLNKKKFLSFVEMNNLKYDIHYKGDFFKDKNLDVIDNSEDEILNSCIEMINFKKNGFLRSEKSIFTQNKFWQQFEDNIKLERNIFEIREILNFGISDYFINKNAELLK